MSVYKQPCDDAVIIAASEPVSSQKRSEPWVLAATIVGSSMAFIDGTVVNLALPILQVELQATVLEAQWVVEAYALFLSALMLVGGSLGDRFGRRRIYIIGIISFALASLLCGLALTPLQLIIARALQGIGAALLVPGSLAIISSSFSEADRGRAIGTWSGFSAMTTALGPVVGGYIIEQISWRWVFFMNVPMAVFVVCILIWRVPENRVHETQGPLDWVGALLATLGLGGLIYGLIEASHMGFTHPTILSTLILGTAMLVALIVVESRHPEPMLPLTLFRSRTFSGANLLTLLLYAAFGGTMFFLPFNLLQVQGYTATEAGAVFLPFIALMFLLSRWSGGLIQRYGAKLPLTVGPVIAAVGLGMFAVPGIGGSYWTTFFPAICIFGFGMAVSAAPLTTAVLNASDVEHAGVASGINNAISRTGGLIAIAVLGIVMVSSFTAELQSRLETINPPAEVQQQLMDQRIQLAAIEVPADVDSDLAATLERAIDEAFVAGFRLVMIICALLALGSALSALLLIESTRHRAAASSREE